jgi:NhaP-type Na+/H+ or K+/H+ antiporter
MTAVLAFAVALLAAVLISQRAQRTAFSTSVLFLAAGLVAGPAVLGLLRLGPSDAAVTHAAELTLFSTLFADGLRIDAHELRRGWALPARALLIGLPLTMLVAALAGHWLLRLSWQDAWLLSAVLAPTDPVFAAAIVRREQLPEGLRRLLNVESGFNDGLALPVVLALLAPSGIAGLLAPLAGGIAIGAVIPWIVDRLERSSAFGATREYRPIAAVAVALLVFAASKLLGANDFLAAFAAGISAVSSRPTLSPEFRVFSETVAELLKFVALFVFGSLLTWGFFSGSSWRVYAFAAFVLLVSRPLPVLLCLLGAPLDYRSRLTAAWFGPKGFASVVYGIIVAERHPGGMGLFAVAALVITVSIVAHSSTDVLIADWLASATGRRGGSDRAPLAVGAER